MNKVTYQNFYQNLIDLMKEPCSIDAFCKATGTKWSTRNFSFSNICPLDKLMEFYKKLHDEYGIDMPREDFDWNIKDDNTFEMKTGYSGGILLSNKDDINVALEIFQPDAKPRMVYYEETKESINVARNIMELWLKTVLPFRKQTTEKFRLVDVLCKTQNGFIPKTIPLGEKLNINIEENYMPSLPNDKIKECIKKDRGGFLIFRGEPGTGKSSYLKYLIESMEDTTFVVLDPNDLTGGAEGFKNYLLDNAAPELYKITTCSCYGIDKYYDDPDPMLIESKSSGAVSVSKPEVKKVVYIIEDAEKLLRKREENAVGFNISNLLQITDGLTGDLAKAKFICTFNCKLNELDPAILRKGRLLQMYEFPKLSGETLEKLLDKVGVPQEKRKPQMSLADIYGWDLDTGLSDSDKAKIGF